MMGVFFSGGGHETIFKLVVEEEKFFQWADPWMIMMMMKIHLCVVNMTLE